MPPRRRSPVLPVSLTVLAVLVLLSVGIYLGGHPEDLPGPIRSALVSDDVKTTQEAFDLIEQVGHDAMVSLESVDRGPHVRCGPPDCGEQPGVLALVMGVDRVAMPDAVRPKLEQRSTRL